MSQFGFILKFSQFNVIISLVSPVFLWKVQQSSFLCSLIVVCFVLTLLLPACSSESSSNFTILRLVLSVNMFGSHGH